MEHRRLPEIHPQMEDELRMNREADYAGAVDRGWLDESCAFVKIPAEVLTESRSD